MCWFIRYKARVRIPGETTKENMKKILLWRFPLSRFLVKALRVNKNKLVMKRLLKNLSLGVDFKTVIPATYGVRDWVNNPDRKVAKISYVCMYAFKSLVSRPRLTTRNFILFDKSRNLTLNSNISKSPKFCVRTPQYAILKLLLTELFAHCSFNF